MNAGLTSLQSRVYLALIKEGKTNVTRISEVSDIDKSNVYRALKDLEKLELIETQIGPSKIYKPVPLSICLSILLKKKKEDFYKLRKNLNKLAKEVDSFYEKANIPNKDVLKIYPSGSFTFCRKWEKTLKKVQNSVDLIATEHREPKDDPIWDIYVDLLKKGVKVRWIIDRSFGDDKEFAMRVKQFQHLFRYPTIEMKICYNCLEPYGVICDNKLVIIFLCDKPPIKYAKTLWTNNRQILLNFKEHFEINWSKGICHTLRTTTNPTN